MLCKVNVTAAESAPLNVAASTFIVSATSVPGAPNTSNGSVSGEDEPLPPQEVSTRQHNTVRKNARISVARAKRRIQRNNFRPQPDCRDDKDRSSLAMSGSRDAKNRAPPTPNICSRDCRNRTAPRPLEWLDSPDAARRECRCHQPDRSRSRQRTRREPE